jgi:hypothetical protein
VTGRRRADPCRLDGDPHRLHDPGGTADRAGRPGCARTDPTHSDVVGARPSLRSPPVGPATRRGWPSRRAPRQERDAGRGRVPRSGPAPPTGGPPRRSPTGPHAVTRWEAERRSSQVLVAIYLVVGRLPEGGQIASRPRSGLPPTAAAHEPHRFPSPGAECQARAPQRARLRGFESNRRGGARLPNSLPIHIVFVLFTFFCSSEGGMVRHSRCQSVDSSVDEYR